MHSSIASAVQSFRWIAVVAFIAIVPTPPMGATVSGHVSHLYHVQSSTGEIIAGTFRGTDLKGANAISHRGAAGWALIGVADFDAGHKKAMFYSEPATGQVAVIFHGGAGDGGVQSYSKLASPGEGWTASAIADLNRDGHPDVIFVDKASGQVDAYFYGGTQGTTFLKRETVGSLSATGWNIVAAADLDGDGVADLVLQNPSTRQILVSYLGGPNGTAVTATEELGSELTGWTAAGMQDMNGDGHPDLILVNDATGESTVRYCGGTLGLTPLGTASLEGFGSRGWIVVVPIQWATTAIKAEIFQTGAGMESRAVPVLLFTGTGTTSGDVAAVKSILNTLGLGYDTATSSQLNNMSQAQLAAYNLFIVPGGNSITIGKNITSKATTNVKNAVAQNGLNYLGICAGGFFGGFSKYNGLDLTSGTWFSFYADYDKGIHKEPVKISFPSQQGLDIYWQNGPDLSGWGQVVGKYPNGKPAIVEGKWGAGFVVLLGVHPEAPASWRNGMHFTTPVDVDLAYAATLVNAALKGTTLPHY